MFCDSAFIKTSNYDANTNWDTFNVSAVNYKNFQSDFHTRSKVKKPLYPT